MIKSYLKDVLLKEFIEGVNTFLVKPEFWNSNDMSQEFSKMDLEAEARMQQKKKSAQLAKQNESRKYPIEDSELVVDEVHILPIPSQDYILPKEYFSQCLALWNFFYQYGYVHLCLV